MILFSQEYSKYPNAIIDYKTKNESFLRTAKILHTMKIKNWSFHLTLHDKSLQGINPFDDTISLEQQSRIAIEAKNNPWYAIRELIRIPELGISEGVQYKLNRANLFMLWSFFNHIDILLIHIRQTGKSVSIDGLMSAILFIIGINTKIHLVTKDSKLRHENIERIKEIRDLLPWYFYEQNPRDANNRLEVTNVALGNQYVSSVAQASVSGAIKVGRGTKAQISLFDEGPYIANIGETMPAALSAGTAARNQAKKNNGFYGNIISTTAGLRDTKEGRFVYKLLENATPWTEHFYDSRDRVELLERIEASGSKVGGINAPMLAGVFSHRQLGYSDEWLKESIANSRGGTDQIKRDFLNIWTTGSLQSPLTEADNEKVFNSVIEPMYVEFIPSGYMLRWYLLEPLIESYMSSGQYVLGVDTSDAIGNDNIGFVVLNISTLETVAVAAINETNLIFFSHWLSNFMIEHDTITLIIEMASNARAIIDVLLIELPNAGIDPFKRIYNSIVDSPEEHKEEYKDICRPFVYRQKDFYVKYRKYFGLKPTPESRNLIYGNILQLAVKRAGHLVRDEILSREIRGLIIKNGKIDHTTSGNDDTCMAWLLCHWFLVATSNHGRYGIDTIAIMSDVSKTKQYSSEKERKEADKQQILRKDIDELVNRLCKIDNALLIVKLEQKLKLLTSQMSDNDNDLYNMDSIIRKAKELREKRRKNKVLAKRL